MSVNNLSILSISINGSNPGLNSDLALSLANRANSCPPSPSSATTTVIMSSEQAPSQISSQHNNNESTKSSGNSSPRSRTSDDMPMPVRSYNKWAPSEQGSTLVWRDLCVYTQCPQKGIKNGLKRIINNATGAIQPGTLMALMGSSGAGKSTLMSALAYRNAFGTSVHGDILLNGRQIGPFMHRISGFVHQDDLFLGTLTVIEHLTFMAHLRLDRRITRVQKINLISELLESTGLIKCTNTVIGDSSNSNVLSGGEKKRLAFATELLTKPTILFCDEPTTGLDSFGAQQLVGTMQSLAQRGTTIMCTIHQPSSQLFSMFQQVCLLAEGRVAFCGTPEQALDFFAENGYECPKTYNPADFLIEVLAHSPGNERASQKAVHRLCDLFAVSKAAEQRDFLVNLELHLMETGNFEVAEEEKRFCKQYWPVTVYYLFYRVVLTIFRDPTIQFLKLLQKIIIALMAALCFSGSLNLTQQGIQGIQGCLFIIVSENTFTAMYSVLAIFPQGFPLFVREKHSGIYNTVQYYIAQILAMIPGLILEPLLFVIVCYWLAGLRATVYAFFMTVVIAVMVMSVATACGCLFSTAFNSVPLAMSYIVPFDYLLMITSGVFIKLNSISPYIAWMQLMSWFMYANEALTIIQWQGVENITCYEENETLPCLHNGIEVLDQYSFNENNLAKDLWSMVSLYTVFNLMALFFLWKRARNLG